MDFIKKSAAKSHMVDDPHSVYYTMEEVSKHKTVDDVWTVHLGMVYDITDYARVHPGGKKIMLGAGKDCTELFNKYHPWVNCGFLIGKYHIGMVKR
jgi:cytochrome-b5 reductase